jgi:hypothetical protein
MEIGVVDRPPGGPGSRSSTFSVASLITAEFIRRSSPALISPVDVISYRR